MYVISLLFLSAISHSVRCLLYVRFIVQDKIKIANDEIAKEKEKALEAQQEIAKIDEFEQNLNYKQIDLEQQEAVYAKQKECLGKDDLSDKHSYQELKEMLRELTDQRHGNEATRSLEQKENEYAEIEHTVERLRRKANELNSRKGKLEAEKEAHSK